MKKLTPLLFALTLILTACNFHEVDHLLLYRSGQLKADEFQKAIDKIGIKTIINLRGEAPGKTWFDDEKAVAEKNGIYFVNIAMSAERLPHRRDLIKLLDALRDAPRPILIHCLQGADRTGEATALYEMIYMGKSREEAMEMLNPKYHHLEALYPAKDYFIREVWQGEDWARKEYDPCSGQYKYYDPNNPECKGQHSNQVLGENEDT